MAIGDAISRAFNTTFGKDIDNLDNSASKLWNNAQKKATQEFDRLTQDKLVSKAKAKRPRGVGQNTASEVANDENSGRLAPGVVFPEATADNGPMYTAKAPSKTYQTPAPGKATGGLDANAGANEGKPINDGDAYWSLFNKWSLIKYRGAPGQAFSDTGYNEISNKGIENINVNRRNPTASVIIDETSKLPNAEGYSYSFSDFALAKYYGKIPNDFLITVRRFPMPVEDDIINPNVLGPDGKTVKTSQPDLARAVTWMSDATGNNLSDIMKFSVKTAWDEVKSELQSISSSGNRGGVLGDMISNNPLATAIYGAAQGLNASQINAAQNGYDPLTDTYPNHVFGPLNIIDKIVMRKPGLDFSQDIELTFHYDLRQLKGVNPRIAFLDLMANLLVLTYNNGNFWGGATRYQGGTGAFNKPFGDFSKLQSGDYAGFLGGLLDNALSGIGNIGRDILNGGFLDGSPFSAILNSNVGQNIIGGNLIKMFGTPQGAEAVKAFLTGDATGQYHITFGNPLNPIAVMGNMYCDSTDFQFGGELSYDGFPTELTMTMSLKPARPRDKADIERMFNGGKGRLYLTPEDGVDTNRNFNPGAYGTKDVAKTRNDILNKMANG